MPALLLEMLIFRLQILSFSAPNLVVSFSYAPLHSPPLFLPVVKLDFPTSSLAAAECASPMQKFVRAPISGTCALSLSLSLSLPLLSCLLLSLAVFQGWGRYFENVSKIRYRYTKGLCLLYLQILQIQIPLNWLKIGQRYIQKIQIDCIF